MKLFDSIQDYCRKLESEFKLIPPKRQKELAALSDYFQKKFESGETPRAIVICTHNSRRSHLGQIWLSTGADYFDLPKIETFSGGTEATAFNPRAVAAMQRIGFEINSDNLDATNPTYLLRWKDEMSPYPAFSKKYDDEPNPQSNFAAIMVCTEADAGCPVVLGTDFRLPLPYDDPKAFDGTDLESEKYEERAQQIGKEMLFCLSLIKK